MSQKIRDQKARCNLCGEIGPVKGKPALDAGWRSSKNPSKPSWVCFSCLEKDRIFRDEKRIQEKKEIEELEKSSPEDENLDPFGLFPMLLLPSLWKRRK